MLYTQKDVEEVVNGAFPMRTKWIFREGNWLCSHCKNRAIKTEGGYFAITHYCGNCGRKMCVEEEET